MKALFWIVVGVLFIDYMLVRGGARLRDEETINIKEKDNDGRN